MSKVENETTHIRIYRVDMKRLWNLISYERKTIADVITYILDRCEKPHSEDDSQLEVASLNLEE